jgi:hypothetical protein
MLNVAYAATIWRVTCQWRLFLQYFKLKLFPTSLRQLFLVHFLIPKDEISLPFGHPYEGAVCSTRTKYSRCTCFEYLSLKSFYNGGLK